MGLRPFFRPAAPPRAWPPRRDAAGMAPAFRYARERDPIGDRLHLASAALFAASLPIATMPKDVFAAILAVTALLRLHATWRCVLHLTVHPIAILIVAWSAWSFATLLWSDAPLVGAEALKSFRYAFVMGAMWPVLDRGRTIVAAFVAGTLVLAALQLGQALEVGPLRPTWNGRLPGLLHPVSAGGMAATALLLLAATALAARARRALPAAVLALACGASLVATGSRGPWLAALVGGGVLAVAMLVRGGRVSRRRTAAGAVLAVLGIAAAVLVGGERVRGRIDAAQREVAAAVDGAYDTDVGHRIGAARAAVEIWRDAPVVGIGEGDFAAAWAETAVARGGAEWEAGHAHSLWFHVLATSGVAGLALVALLAATSIAFPIVRAAGSADLAVALGVGAALAAWWTAALFDVSHHVGSVFALGNLLLALAGGAGLSAAPAGEDDACTA